MNHQENKFKYLVRLGDNALMQGNRLSEWCSKGPILEEDLALTNIALDNIGRAQALLRYAAEIEGQNRTEDDLAYKRDERQFYNHLITELPIGNFATTIAKQLAISVYEYYVFTALCISTDETLAGISAKTLKEVKYHLQHAHDWCLRLGKGTQVSHEKIQTAFNEIWMYTGELFEMDDVDQSLIELGIAVDLANIKNSWTNHMNNIMQEANIDIPNIDYMQTGSRKGIHTEYLGHMLSEMQYLQRAYPDAIW